MSSLLIRGTTLKSFKTFCNKSGQMVVEAKFRASWSDTVCSTMGWVDKTEGIGNANLEGKLFGISLSMEPNKPALKDYRFDISINQVAKFKHVVAVEEGEVVGRHLEFVASSTAEDAHQVLYEYAKHLGPGEDIGQAKIQYAAEKQMKIGEDAEPPIAAEEAKPRGRKRDQAVQ
jgi:hypothetical protein